MISKLKYEKSMFVSPHFDDALFSAGGYILEELTPSNVIVVNVFTEVGESGDSISAKKYLYNCGYKRKEDLYKDRNLEDKYVFDKLGIRRINLGFVEALWRAKEQGAFVNILGSMFPEVKLVYPTFRFNILRGVISKHDVNLIQSVAINIQKIVDSNNIKNVFAPIGVGNHVDHIVAREATKKLKNVNVIFWEDYPYNIKDSKSFDNYRMFEYKPDWTKKDSLMKMYKSQYRAVFDRETEKKSEIFYTK